MTIRIQHLVFREVTVFCHTFHLQTVNVYCSATLMLTGSLNYEVEGQIDLSIEATDTMNAAASLNLSIEVLNVNDPPTVSAFYNAST